MTIIRTKKKLATLVSIIIVSLVAVTTAGAIDSFPDVADGRFFHDPVKWASDNGITTGTSPITFEPDRGVTRGESVTFLKRYDDTIVQPALAKLTGDVAANAADIAAHAPVVTRLKYESPGFGDASSPTFSYAKVRDLGSFTTVNAERLTTIVVNGHATVTGTTDFCHYQIRVDGLTDVGLAPATYEAASGGNAVLYATSAYTIEVVFNNLAPGAHTIELHVRGSAATCTHNFGDFNHLILVREELVSTDSSLSPLIALDRAGETNGGGQ